MAEYQSGGHAKYDIKYHLVWITKYRYQILRGEVAERARELIRQTCQMRDVRIVRGAVSADHVHMLVSAPPHLAPSKLVQYIKGRSSRRLQDEFPHLRKRYWGNTCGGGGISARRWARWTSRPCGSTSRVRSGMRTWKGFALSRPSRLEPASAGHL